MRKPKRLQDSLKNIFVVFLSRIFVFSTLYTITLNLYFVKPIKLYKKLKKQNNLYNCFFLIFYIVVRINHKNNKYYNCYTKEYFIDYCESHDIIFLNENKGFDNPFQLKTSLSIFFEKFVNVKIIRPLTARRQCFTPFLKIEIYQNLKVRFINYTFTNP